MSPTSSSKGELVQPGLEEFRVTDFQNPGGSFDTGPYRFPAIALKTPDDHFGDAAADGFGIYIVWQPGIRHRSILLAVKRFGSAMSDFLPFGNSSSASLAMDSSCGLNEFVIKPTYRRRFQTLCITFSRTGGRNDKSPYPVYPGCKASTAWQTARPILPCGKVGKCSTRSCSVHQNPSAAVCNGNIVLECHIANV